MRICEDGKTDTFCVSLVSIANTPQENSLLKTSSLLSISKFKVILFCQNLPWNFCKFDKTDNTWVADISYFNIEVVT